MNEAIVLLNVKRNEIPNLAAARRLGRLPADAEIVAAFSHDVARDPEKPAEKFGDWTALRVRHKDMPKGRPVVAAEWEAEVFKGWRIVAETLA